MSPIGLPGVATTSLLAFIVVYAVVFAAGIGFVLKLMGRPPVPGEPDPPQDQPIRTAGITPGLAGAVPEAPLHGIGQVPAE